MRYNLAMIELTLDSFAYGGECFGRLQDGRAVFVPHALPGERVRIRLTEQKRGYARGELLEVLTPAPERIKPRCPYYFRPSADTALPAACGGCHYQHLPYETQLQAKTDILSDQLQRIGKLKDPPILPAVPSPVQWHYRNHVQFHLTAEGDLGFKAARSDETVPVEACLLPETPLAELLSQLDFEAIPGLERVSLRLGAGDDILINLESNDPQPFSLTVDLPVSVVHHGPGGSLVLAGDDHIVIEVLQRPFRVSAGAFFQVNTAMAAQMVTHLLENLDVRNTDTVVDAYCGAGLFSAFLAQRARRVIGIETSPQACEDFVVNLDEFDNVELYEAPVEKTLPALDVHADLLVADPPRAGLGRQTLEGIASLKPREIAYISCDPATLGRDARYLTEMGYYLRQITPFDLFPQTYHIESISFWARYL